MAELLTVQDAARILRLSAYTVRQMAREKRLPALRVAGRWRFLEEDLRHWLEQKRWTDATLPTGPKSPAA